MHRTHPDIVPRLKRAEGHLRSVIAMIEEGRDGLALAQQLHAVEAAVAKAKQALIFDHIEHLLEESRPAEVQEALRDMKAFAKYL
ncbi:nickel resistance protein [Pigmentiphaga sp. NML080357]|uniref:metal-sensing transcriptional repressor n=1 Tax=Pigmentiphaga sp. NML080357 TaxID=2008675 RepID=UPI000B4103C4|nr:metal-sensing transcriptional repressor [Pigmentiphaga sp. NML080357]OVZ57140.1 nickel resistance protein [Pigmentiphaga sp. NML080357]